MLKHLDLRAGPRALARIRAHGIARDDVKVIAGAAGGPKWLILGHLDRFIFGEWLADSPQKIDLVGASIGAWRFAAACHNTAPLQAINALETAYVEQRYSTKPDRREITRVIRDIQGQYFDKDVLAGVLNHPRLRLTAITARSRGPIASENRTLLGGSSGVSALSNTVKRAWLGRFFERVLFTSPGAASPLFAADGIPTKHVALNAANARDAVFASGSIPMLMSGVANIEGAPPGMYRDGGIVDYHIDQPLLRDGQEGIVLMPHFSDRVVPGWFDKFASWRRARFTENLLMLSPSAEFLQSIPNGKVPDRKDFHLYNGDNEARIKDWRRVVGQSEQLAEEFQTWLADPEPARFIKPL